MPEDLREYLYSGIILLAVLCTVALIVRGIYRLFQDRYSPITSVEAKVVDKYIADDFSKVYGKMAKKPQYYVVFAVKNKKRSFRVSEWSYGRYKISDCGMLKYQGNRLIEFS